MWIEEEFHKYPNLSNLDRYPLIPQGTRFNRLVVLIPVTGRRGWRSYLCICDCGNEFTTTRDSLERGNAKSCGCLHSETSRSSCVERNTSHQMSGTTEYYTYHNMLLRCYDSRSDAYPWYGGSGIGVCDRWRDSFENFFSDMGLKPSRFHSIERNDSSKDYSPDNCRWATAKEQSRNRRNTRWVTYQGREMSAAEFCEAISVGWSSVRNLLNKGMTCEEIENYFAS